MLFSHLVAADDFELLGAQPSAVPLPPFGMLDTVPGPALARAQMWERHLIEVETGLPPDSVEGCPTSSGVRPAVADPLSERWWRVRSQSLS